MQIGTNLQPRSNSRVRQSRSPRVRRRAITLAVAAFGAANLATAFLARAATFTWDGGTTGTATDMSVAANWSPDVIPGTGDVAQWNGLVSGDLSLTYNNGYGGTNGVFLSLTSAQTGKVNIDEVGGTGGFRLQNITLASGSGALTLGSVSASAFTLGSTSVAAHTFTNNSSNPFTISSNVTFGFGSAVAHSVTLAGSGNFTFNPKLGTGGGSLSSLTMSGTGTVTVTSQVGGTGQSAARSIFLKSGNFVVDNGGSITSSVFTSVGQTGADVGTLIIRGNGGFNETGADFNVGDVGTTVGTLIVQDTGSLVVGSSSAGGLFIGSANGAASSAAGNVFISGGTITANATGDGLFVLGGRNAASALGTATLTMTGGAVNGNGNLWVGGYGSGTVNQSAGSVTVANFISIGRQATGKGIWNLSGGSIVQNSSTGTFVVGEQGIGTLNVSGTGTIQANGGLELGVGAAATGTVTLSGTGMISTPRVFQGAGLGTFNFNGGTLQARTSTVSFMGGLTAANVGTFGAVIDTQGNTIGISQPLLHDVTGPATDGGLAVYGGGTLNLSGAPTYTGPTTVNSGTLLLNNVNISTSSALTVNGGAALSLKDNSLSTTSVGGPVSLTDSTLNMELGSSASDQITTTAAASINGNNTINVSLAPGQGLNSGTYTLLHATGGLGSNFTLGTTPIGFFNFSLSSSTATDEILSVTGNPTPATAYWTGAASVAGGDSSNNWGFGATITKSNWSTNASGTADALQLPGGTSDVIFTAANAVGSGGLLNTSLDGTYAIKSLTFDVPFALGIANTAISTNGNSLVIGSGGMTMASTSGSSATISGGGTVSLSGSQTWSNNSNSQSLNVTTPVNALGGITTLTFGGTGAGGINITNTIGDGGGTVSLVVSNPVVALSANNTYTGTTTITSGELDILNGGRISSDTTIASGGKLLLFQGSDSFGDANAITVQSGGVLNVRDNAGNDKTETIGALAGAGTVTCGAAGTTTLTIGSSSNLSSAFSGVIQDGAGKFSVTKSGAGTLALTGLNTYTGQTTVTAGVLQAHDGVGIPTASNLALNGGLLLTSGTFSRTVGTDVGQFQVSGSTGFATDGADLTINLLNGGSPVSYGGAFNPGTLVLNTASSTNNINIATDLDVSPANHFIQINAGTVTFTGALSNSGTLATFGAGTIVIPNSNPNYSGNFLVGINNGGQRTGVLQLNADNALGTAGSISIGPGGNDATARLELFGGHTQSNLFVLAQRNNSTVSVENVSGNNTLAGTVSIQAGGNTVILQSDSGLLTMSGTLQSVATSTTPRTVTFAGSSPVSGLVSGLIRDNDGVAAVSLAIVKAGTGTWTISGTNTYTGGTAVTAGTLVMTAPQALGGGSVTVNSGTLDIQTNGTDSYTLNMNSTNNGTIVLDLLSAGPAVNRNYANFNVGINDTMTFVSGVNVTSGVPVLALTGVNLSSGVGGGTSTLNPVTATLAIGTVSTSTNSGKTLNLAGSSVGNTITGAITDGSNTVSLAKIGTSAWVLSGNNTYTGPTTVKAGTLELASNSQAPLLTNAGGADIQGGRMILDYSGTSPAVNLRAALAAGRVRDSVATAGIGVAYFDDGSARVVVRPDLFGDANGDNVVNMLDFNALATNFGTGQFWQQGDFSYDGVVSTPDFNLLAQNFNQVTPSLEPSLAPALGTLVPEPASLGVLSAMGLAFSRRRRIKPRPLVAVRK